MKTEDRKENNNRFKPHELAQRQPILPMSLCVYERACQHIECILSIFHYFTSDCLFFRCVLKIRSPENGVHIFLLLFECSVQPKEKREGKKLLFGKRGKQIYRAVQNPIASHHSIYDNADGKCVRNG